MTEKDRPEVLAPVTDPVRIVAEIAYGAAAYAARVLARLGDGRDAARWPSFGGREMSEDDIIDLGAYCIARNPGGEPLYRKASELGLHDRPRDGWAALTLIERTPYLVFATVATATMAPVAAACRSEQARAMERPVPAPIPDDDRSDERVEAVDARDPDMVEALRGIKMGAAQEPELADETEAAEGDDAEVEAAEGAAVPASKKSKSK